MKSRTLTAGNCAAWNEVAPLHRQQNQARLLHQFMQPGYTCLDATATKNLNAIGMSGKDVAQLCCNNGRELVSVKNMGANRCVGFDGASGFIEQAQELAAAAGQECEFVQCDVYDIAPEFNGAFDVVMVTIGVLNWMPDVAGFFAAGARLLRPNGVLFIYEQHPIMDMVEPGQADDPVVWSSSYFRKGPRVDTEGLDYYGGTPYEALPCYEIQHTLADVMMAGIQAGLRVSDFQEHPQHISNTWYNVESQGLELPMSYTLIMTKTAND